MFSTEWHSIHKKGSKDLIIEWNAFHENVADLYMEDSGGLITPD